MPEMRKLLPTDVSPYFIDLCAKAAEKRGDHAAAEQFAIIAEYAVRLETRLLELLGDRV